MTRVTPTQSTKSSDPYPKAIPSTLTQLSLTKTHLSLTLTQIVPNQIRVTFALTCVTPTSIQVTPILNQVPLP